MISFVKHNLHFESVNTEDAEFILSLRSDPQLNKYLSFTNTDINVQREWIQKYKNREEAGSEFYFVAKNSQGEKLGLNRIYNIKETQFEIGSWVYKNGIDISIPVLGDLGVRDYAFENFKVDKCVFEVRKNNKQVLKYHKMFIPTLISEDEDNFYFELSFQNYLAAKERILKILKK